MAEVSMPGRRAYWSKYAMDSSEESVSAFVPGVSAPGNKRPFKMQGRRTPEVKARIPVKQPLIEQVTVSQDSITDISGYDSEKSSVYTKPRPTNVKVTSGVKVIRPGHQGNSKSVSLKDLPLEEKKRIANLIKELARVGDEKEKAIDQLHVERNQFEKQVLQLVDQQEKILNEREVIQNQLFQCQDLLSRYQEKIEQKQQEVVNLITTPSKGQDSRHPRSRSRSPESSMPYTSHCHGNHAEPTSRGKLYTSYIDKEIANQRSAVEGDTLSSIGGQSGISEGPLSDMAPPRGRYPDRLPLVLRNPIMSSTQKSSDIKVFNSEGSFHYLQPDPSPRSSRTSNELMPGSDNKEGQRSKVGFKDKLEDHYDKLHSPNLDPSGVFGDKSYMSYYKKLSQTDRKRELLRQREKLLDEQRRLKSILMSQENQLKTRQKLIHRQKELQQDRMEFFDKNGKFPLEKKSESPRNPTPVSNTSPEDKAPSLPKSSPPPLVLNHGGDDDGSLFEYEVKKLDFDLADEEGKEDGTKTPPKSERQQRSMATSPIIRMDSPGGSVHRSPGRGVDVATSVSHINLSPRTQKHNESIEDLLLGQKGDLPFPDTRGSSDHSPRHGLHGYQNNLPLPSNRGRSNQSPVSKPGTGNKTLSVIEILNTMETSPSWSGSLQVNRNSPGWSGGGHRHKNNPAPVYSTPQEQSSLYDFVEAEEEESQILEDVFFLK